VLTFLADVFKNRHNDHLVKQTAAIRIVP
jgi:hypothetical protein